jgi:hypothetical protein
MTPAQISQHELRHILGEAVAVVALCPGQYKDASVLFSMDGKGGETALLLPDDPKTERQIAALSALAPIAKAGSVEAIIKLVKDGTESELRAAGDLSDKDVSLAKGYDGGGTLPMQVVIGALELEKALGVSRFRSLSKRLRDASNQGLVFMDGTGADGDRGWPLTDIVPEAKAQAAHRRAKDALSAVLAPPPRKLTAAERRTMVAGDIATRGAT